MDLRAIDARTRSVLLRQLGPFAITALTAWIAVLVGTTIDWTE
jgi:hypothetical protein